MRLFYLAKATISAFLKYVFPKKHFMKKITVAVVSMIVIISCTKNSSGVTSNNNNSGGTTGYTPSCTGTAKSFSADVLPIFQNVCSAAGCHNSGSTNGPGPLTNYSQISAAKSNIRSAVLSGLMPKNSTLTSAQKDNIICWIDSGAPNN